MDIRDEHELLVRGGTVLPMAGAERAEAMLVSGGRVVRVGSEAECAAAVRASEVETVDLDGATVMPGFVDAHCHPLMFGQFQTWTDCGWEVAPDVETVINRLRDSGERLEPGAAVRGHGYHHGNVAESRHLRREDLDRVADDREVLVFHSSGHGAYVNSWALRQLGVTGATPDPRGGHLGRRADGEPDGSVWDAAADLLTGPDGVKIGNHGPNFHLGDALDVQVGQLRLAQEILLAAGVTSVVDAQVTSRELRAYLALRREGGLTMRVEMLVLSSLLGQLEQLGLGGRLGDDRFAFAGLKLYVDGALTAGTAHFGKPYCCDPRDHGYQYHEVAEITDLIRRAHDLGLQTGTHAQGDAAIGIALDALEAATAAAPRRDPRHRIEHCGFPQPEHVERIARLGVHPVTQPQYVHRFGDELSEALGDRAHRLTPLGEFAAAGVPVVLSSDAPVCPPKPLEAVYAAVARTTLSGAVLGGEQQRIDVMAALRGHTLGAAASIHREATIGSLEPGKYADFVVLDADPTRVAVEELPQIEVRGTWIDGARVSDGVAPTEVVRSLR